jgi:flagellar biosynthesis protein FlhF
MAGALALVKQEFGANARVLHTRTYKRGGLLGFGTKNVVEVTAADDGPAHAAKQRDAQPPRRRELPRRPLNPAAAAPSRGAPVTDTPAGDLIRRTYQMARDEISRREQTTAGTTTLVTSPVMSAAAEQLIDTARSAATPAVAPVSPMYAVPSNQHQQLQDEMRVVQRMVAKVMQGQRQQGGAAAMGNMPESLFNQYLSLLKQEVAEELAEEVVGQVQQTLSASDLDDEQVVRKSVRDVVAQLLPSDASAGKLMPTADGRPRTIALIGPTGVGKTTTIAKLAATFKLKQKKKVGLVTLDTYRIAAVDQLRTYADIIGVPLHVAVTEDELRSALKSLSHCDVILIDTAGRSQKDDPKLAQLKSFIDAADPHEVHLVLSSTCTQNVLLDTAERFSAIRADRIIFTKLDEAVSFGVLLNVARRVNKRLSYITTGQEVPHQIEPGRADRLAELVLGGEV